MYPDINGNTAFWCLDKDRNKILRDFKEENDNGFTIKKCLNGEDGFDDMNYMFWENFQMLDIHGSNGSDYERHGCQINPGDIVVDIGANVGMFSRWAKLRGAGRIIAFEPGLKAFSCLIDNVGDNVECYNIAIADKIGVLDMKTLDNFANLGGGTALEIEGRQVVDNRLAFMLSLHDLFNIGVIPQKVDFLKIDCEGGESIILNTISDEDLLKFNKISMEYHNGLLGNELRERTTSRMQNLGYSHFTLYHGNGDLVQLHYWKNK